MEWMIHVIALLLALSLAAVLSLRFSGTAGDVRALAGWRALKSIGLVVLLAWLLLGTQSAWAGALFLLGYLLLAQWLAVQPWFKVRSLLQPVTALARHMGFLGMFAPKDEGPRLTSKEELKQLIMGAPQALTQQQKDRLLAGLELDRLTIADVMVAREAIKTVDVGETVGPLLLDRLHKDGHNIFVVVKKDLGDVRGLLYMRDIVEPDPEIKTVKDALRPNVQFLPAAAPLEAVLGAAVTTGRQLFLVRGDNDDTVGLITLADALTKITGGPISKTLG